MNSLLSFVDKEVCVFCDIHKSFHGFRIGSSLYYDDLKSCNDIDLLFIDRSSDIDYRQQMNLFYKHYNSNNYWDYNIETPSDTLVIFLEKLKEKLKEKYNKNIIYYMGFGPLKSNDEDSLKIHVAGPMNLVSMNYFFTLFPSFYMVFSKHNKSLNKNSFNDLIEKRFYQELDIREEIKMLVDRAANAKDCMFKLQCLKKIKLILSIHQNIVNPYLHTSCYINSIDLKKIDIEFKRYQCVV